MVRLQGGSAGEVNQQNTGNKYGSFFYDDVKDWMLSNKDSVSGRILPAFDDEQFQPNDPAFKTSVKPYRCLDAAAQWREAKQSGSLSSIVHLLDGDTETPRFTDWFITVQGYVFYGPDKQKFLSPISALPPSQKFKAGHDPIVDTLNYVKGLNDPSLEPLFKKKTMKDSIPLMYPRHFTCANVEIEKENNQKEVRVLVWNSMTQDQLKQTLKQRGGREDAIISEQFQEFLFGDITDPVVGSRFNTVVQNIGQANIPTSIMMFSADNQDLSGRVAAPVDETVLAQRYDLMDTDSVTKIATYDEILEHLVNFRKVPMQYIEAACSSYGNIPSNAPAVHGQSQVQNAGIPQQTVSTNTVGRSVSVVDPAPNNAAVTNAIPTPAPVAAPAPVEDDIPMAFPEENEAPAPSAGGALTKDSPEFKEFCELREVVNSQKASVEQITRYGQLAGQLTHLL